MKRVLENKLSMYLAVNQVCNDNTAVWTGVAGCSSAITEFSGKIDGITGARQVQENSHTGVTEDKHAKLDTMTALAMVVKGAVQAYATDTNNHGLYESVNYSVSAIKRQPDTIARDRALLIYNKANDQIAQLTDYGVNAALLLSLNTAVIDYTAMIAAPRIAVGAVKASTAQLDQLFAEADVVLKRKIDKLLLQFETSHPTFYATFLNARQIVDSGKGSKTLEVALNPSEVRTVQRVIDGSVLVNTGATVLRYCADRLPPCDAGDENAVLLQPGDSVDVNITEHFVTLTNTDAVRRGSFKVKVTSTVPVVTTTR